ncbi:MAG: alpha/beta fold hydrolase [Gemmatimonadaceae bacterium]|nr:alpha/beta fold hydrolase [Gemmatimonadaceae bacterium]
MRGEFVDVRGARLYYYAAGTRGAGEPVVLLHGFPTSGHLWADVVPHLPQGHRTIVLDLLGFGRSDRPGSHAVDIHAHADRVIALLDALGINFACLIGHDIGGAIALAAALRHPPRVSRLGLVSAAAFDAWPPRDVKVVRATLPLTRHLPPSWVSSVLRADLLRGYVNADHAARSVDRYLQPFGDADGRDAFFQHLQQLDPADPDALTPRLGDIVQPTAVVWGRNDPFLPVKNAERLAAAIPSATLDIIEEGGHFVPEEQPQEVAQAIGRLILRH